MARLRVCGPAREGFDAQRAGVKPGDEVVSIDSMDVARARWMRGWA